MSTEHITICTCDICGKKVDKLDWFYWGILQYDKHRSSIDAKPDGNTECCNDCKHELYAVVAAKISELKVRT